MNTRIRIPFKEASRLILSYVRSKVTEQIPSVIFIVAYLIVFQTLVLGLPLKDTLGLAMGIILVILGLAFFLEGLGLGLMPLGETIGLKLPKRSRLPGVLMFAFLVGVGATLAEPAVAALKVAGSSVLAWETPLLFALLNTYSYFLVIAIGLGVGIAVCLGMLRFYFSWSLRPLIFILISLSLALTFAAWLSPGMNHIIGLAWDSGAITTGPVTVPLVLALGLGISRIVGKRDSPVSGFGVVTLASTVPIITVLCLGFIVNTSVPQPMSRMEFAAAERRTAVMPLFASENDYRLYVTRNGDEAMRSALFSGNSQELRSWFHRIDTDAQLRTAGFGEDRQSFRRWLLTHGTDEERLLFFGTEAEVLRARASPPPPAQINVGETIARLGIGAVQAVLPLCAFLVLTLLVILRDRLPRPDEVFFGIAIALVGMFLLNAGIEFGLSRLGKDVGQGLPATITAVELPEGTRIIPNFDTTLVESAVNDSGEIHKFFYLKEGDSIREIPFEPLRYNQDQRTYELIAIRGPLFGSDSGIEGLLLLLFFAFVMGFGATMAEPALIQLGKTVEEITVGIFKRRHLMTAVAVGVGLGIAVGVLKIVTDIPLIWILLPVYAVLALLTAFTEEIYVNIGWDSAGVTTGPVTVPLVLAMGLGLGNQIGVVEGFGILAAASAFPILVVLGMGLVIKNRRKHDLATREPEPVLAEEQV